MSMTSKASKTNHPALHAPFAEVVEQLTGWEESLEEAIWGHRLTVDALKLNMPVELRVDIDEGGNVVVKGSAPTQTVETTVMPVFHRIRLCLEIDEES
jgi:hypothetical protein